MNFSIYLIKIKRGYFKIGFTTNFAQRFQSLKRAEGEQLQVLAVYTEPTKNKEEAIVKGLLLESILRFKLWKQEAKLQGLDHFKTNQEKILKIFNETMKIAGLL